ncbi:hypothetical protein [Sulfurimonas sp.]|uniref:hypothetical protein n=1 Tax=Sulfurimonas sp. TaxID=2022749 RepID=UPI002A3596D5|nr:hypothetical protein [Sulfurimonas sp.]MDY0122691.1 hypothetical protein [Sulfurimonas sp.]
METSTAYQSYLNIMQNYQTTQGRRDYQAPFAESFELIYAKAQEQDVKLSNAKNFLESLSQSELRTLQKYSGLADSINVNSLSAEGAYNLLMHDNEQYDFDGNGTAEVGIGKHILPVPINMPADVQEAYISAMNSLSDKDKLMAMTLTFDPARLDALINNKPYTPTNMDYSYLKSRVDNMLNPQNGGYTSPETKESITAFWDAFNIAYRGDKTQDTQSEENSAVEKFLNALRTKGAAKFLADLNQEKIDKMVEEYKQKLIEEMGDSPEAMEKIAKLVDEFKKNLIEEMREKMQDELKNAKDVNSVKLDTFMMTMLNNMQEKKPSPLKELLKA